MARDGMKTNIGACGLVSMRGGRRHLGNKIFDIRIDERDDVVVFLPRVCECWRRESRYLWRGEGRGARAILQSLFSCEDAAEEGALFAYALCESARIDTIDCWYVVFLEPGAEGRRSEEMREFFGVVADNESGDMDSARLEIVWDVLKVVFESLGDAVIADEGVGKDEDLALVGWICERLCVPDHACREWCYFYNKILGCTSG